MDRPRTADRKPRGDEGRNGEMRFVEEGGSTYLYFRSNGSWYRIGSERVR